MSNPKFKVENYQNLGGINSKYSPMLTGPMEFLDIKNFDFQFPGDLTQRWGSTQYMGQTLVGKINALSEYQKLNGSSYVIVGSTAGIWFGATTGNFQGMSMTHQGSTYHFGISMYGSNAAAYFRAIGWENFGGVTFSENNGGVYYKGATNQLVMAAERTLGGFTYDVSPEILPGETYKSIAYLTDYAFIADGKKFIKFDGATTTNVGLPLPIPGSLMFSYDTSFSPTLVGFGLTGAAVFYVSYVNTRGFESNIMPVCSAFGPASGCSISPTTKTGTIAMTLLLQTPLAYGISSINVYSYCIQNLTGYGISYSLWNSTPDLWSYPFTKLRNWPASGSTVTAVPIGSTSAGFPTIYNNNGELPNSYINQYTPLGLTLGPQTISYANANIVGQDREYLYVQAYSNLAQTSFYPQFLEVYDNRLFCAGFSSAPSTVWFSDVKEPEGYLPTNNFEVRTNDSDYITAMKTYQTRIYFFKINSFHVLVGDNPANFFMQEISNQYGCLNNRCVVQFENLLYFLDRKGIIEYTGSNISFASIKIQPIFDRMNYTSALTEACGVHDKLRNQILFAIPIDGSTTNNITIVYDYIAKAWTTHTGYNASIFAEIKGYNTTKRLFHGDYNGRVNWFSASFLSDNGSGITLSYKSRFLHDMGDSVQKQFRRLYVNADPIGTTLSNKINFYQDYGTSIVLGTTLNLGAFQDRIDYGISAKSLAFEMISLNTSSNPLRIHGFVIESRMQRKV